jgi:probable non-F420 flavinoid oxidoreductase
MCSDHFHPWSEGQGHSGFAWSWLGAALEATNLPFGVVTVPGGWRYHPAVIAQAAATLAEMYPGRFWIAPGSGELLNEHVVGQRWPAKAERNARLLEAVEIIRALWAGETVTHDGLLRIEEAKLYSLPAVPPRIVGAALSPETAGWMGGWADGLITIVGERESMRRIVEAFRRGGGEGKPIYLQAQLAFAGTDEAALRGAWEQWRAALFPSPVLADLRTPAQFDAVAAAVTPDEVSGKMRVSADPERHLRWLEEDLALGFAEVNLHNVCREEQERFIDVFGEAVLPRLAGG